MHGSEALLVGVVKRNSAPLPDTRESGFSSPTAALAKNSPPWYLQALAAEGVGVFPGTS